MILDLLYIAPYKYIIITIKLYLYHIKFFYSIEKELVIIMKCILKQLNLVDKINAYKITRLQFKSNRYEYCNFSHAIEDTLSYRNCF